MKIVNIIKNDYFQAALRIILGSIFILAAAGKLPDIAKFVEEVTGIGLLPWKLALVYGSILPWMELVTGICLVLGIFPRIAAAVSILMIISFLVANGTSVYGYRESLCPGCFGDILVKTSDALLIDIFMLVIALPILVFSGGKLRLDNFIGNLVRALIKKRSKRGGELHEPAEI